LLVEETGHQQVAVVRHGRQRDVARAPLCAEPRTAELCVSGAWCTSARSVSPVAPRVQRPQRETRQTFSTRAAAYSSRKRGSAWALSCALPQASLRLQSRALGGPPSGDAVTITARLGTGRAARCTGAARVFVRLPLSRSTQLDVQRVHALHGIILILVLAPG
jgi:hypothetical protein